MLVIVVASTGKHDLSIHVRIGSSEQDFDDDLLMMFVTVSVLIMENSVIEDWRVDEHLNVLPDVFWDDSIRRCTLKIINYYENLNS